MYPFFFDNYRIRKLIKFCITGGAAFAISYFSFLSLNHSYLYYFCVNCSLNNKVLGFLPMYIFFSVVGDTLGFLFGFFSNKSWTFKHQSDAENRYFGKYFAVYAFTFVLGQLLLYFMVHFCSQILWIKDPYFAKIIAAGICAVLNFLGTNYLVFKIKNTA